MSTIIEVEQMNATEAKNRFGDVLATAVKNKAVSLMKHGKPAAYVVSPALYERLVASLRSAPSPLARLERDFEEMITRMQEPESVAVMKGLMSIDTAALRDSLQRSTKSTTRTRKVARRA